MFDREFYRESNPQVALSGMTPLRHYVVHGARDARLPHPLFDVKYYRAQIASERERLLNPILHYKLAGSRRGLEPSPWFQKGFYLAANPDVRRSGLDPFVHFCRHGLRENRQSTPHFSPHAYLAGNADALASGEPALAHFLRQRREGDRVSPGIPGEAGWREPEEALGRDAMKRLSELEPRPTAGTPLVDVVIPVYRGFAETLSCILTVLTAGNDTPYELIVVDDKSPEPELSAALRELADRKLFTLIVNAENQGFVRSVNSGMSAHPDRDVILLNSDTEVYGNWIDRLREAAHREPRIASVTPMTNNGTICSYPNFCADNPQPLELPYADFDALASEANRGRIVDLPTAVGFCMYIRREALEAIGLFDAETFGLGYGEENDFCLRAQALGYRDVLAADVFVRHIGQLSFAHHRDSRVEKALKIIDGRYPHYRNSVHRFIADDPVRPLRKRLDIARLKRFARTRNVLMLNHLRGGGTEQYILTESNRLAGEGAGVFHLRPGTTSPAYAELVHTAMPPPMNLGQFALDRLDEELAPVLREVGITEAQIHSLVDFAPDAPRLFQRFFTGMGLPYRFMVHDYSAVCPRINLVGADGSYCGEADEQGCARCLKRGGATHEARDIRAWRDDYGQLLAAARDVVAPSHDVAARMQRYIPGLNVEVRYHEDIVPGAWTPPLDREDRPLRVGVIGAISKIKGLEVVRAAASRAQHQRLPLRFVVVGYTSDDRAMASAGVEVTGIYHHSHLPRILREWQIDMVFLPSIWPETYSYTLSAALESGLPVAVFDIGAMAERAALADRHLILPLDKAGDPVFLCDALLRFAGSLSPVPDVERVTRELA